MVTPILQLRQIRKTWGDRVAIDDLSLSIAPGETYGLIGPIGAGKSTVFKLICNLLPIDQGTIRVCGQPVSEATKLLVGAVPQATLLYPALTCREHLDFFARLYKLSRVQRRQRVQDCLEKLQLLEEADRQVRLLSSEGQRRLSLAIALVHQPKIVILDEPTQGLDLVAQQNMWATIQQLQQQGITILLITHQVEEAERLCQRVGILKRGQLLIEGTLDSLRQHIPAQEIVMMRTPDELEAIARGREQGFTPRRYQGELAFWVMDALKLPDLLNCFNGITLDSLSRWPVTLAHLYTEIVDGPPQEFFVPEEIADPWD
jgi:ABC-2 type transport system ATP-binding protein